MSTLLHNDEANFSISGLPRRFSFESKIVLPLLIDCSFAD